MSDVSQGPGWWLASDGKWYPPHTAPQAPPVVDPGPTAVPAATQPDRGQWAVDPAAFTGTGAPGTGAPGAAGAVINPTGPVPTPTGAPAALSGAGPSVAEPATGWGTVGFQPHFPPAQPHSYGYPPGVGGQTDVAFGPGAAPNGPTPTSAPAGAPTIARQPEAARRHWQPWLAVVGIGLVLWGAGQGLLAWAQWKVVRAELTPFGTVTQGHLGLALTAAGIVIAGLAVIAAAMVLDRR